MKTNNLLLIVILISFVYLSLKPPVNNEIKIAGNVLLEKIKSLDNEDCINIELQRIFIKAYQELYKSNTEVLEDNVEVLRLIEDKLVENKCHLTGVSIPSDFSSTILTRISGGGGSGDFDYKLPKYMLATFYMNPVALDSYLSILTEEERQEYLENKQELTDKYPDIFKSLNDETNKLKSIDRRNYLNWYFQDSNRNPLKQIDDIKVHQLEIDLKNKTSDFKHN